LTTQADVLTFNYDTVAEKGIASASEIGPKPMPDSLRGDPRTVALADEDLDASHLTWRPALACGFKFDEVCLPVAGVPPYVGGARYYEHPRNSLYENTRVLKLHGSIDWLRYTDIRMHPELEEGEQPEPRRGVVLDSHPSYWFGETPSRDMWRMEPMVEPPLLYKRLNRHPFDVVWDAALETLTECRTLVIVGYSFPSTDFSTRRLFLRAFSEHSLEKLVVVDPNPAVVAIARRLTHFDGAVATCDSLRELYGLPESWLDLAGTGRNE
jgi:hypothetical protein